MYFKVLAATGDHAACGMIALGNTHWDGLTHPCRVVCLSVGYGIPEFLGKNTCKVRAVDSCAAVCRGGREERRRLVTQTSCAIAMR